MYQGGMLEVTFKYKVLSDESPTLCFTTSKNRRNLHSTSDDSKMFFDFTLSKADEWQTYLVRLPITCAGETLQTEGLNLL